MKTLNRILLPTDFSECAHAAFEYACDLKSRYGAKLTLLHIIHDASLEVPDFGMGLAFPGYVENIPQHRKELVESANKSLEKLVNSSPESSSKVDCHVKFGTPIKEILEFVEANGIDMIVIGTHGRTGFTHAIMGSVAERVVRHALCPVLTVRHIPPNQPTGTHH